MSTDFLTGMGAFAPSTPPPADLTDDQLPPPGPRPLCANGCCVECETCSARPRWTNLCEACLESRARCHARKPPLDRANL